MPARWRSATNAAEPRRRRADDQRPTTRRRRPTAATPAATTSRATSPACERRAGARPRPDEACRARDGRRRADRAAARAAAMAWTERRRRDEMSATWKTQAAAPRRWPALAGWPRRAGRRRSSSSPTPPSSPDRSRPAIRWSACRCPAPRPAEYRAHLLWNLRSGLNVAALQCQFSPYLRTVDNYNAHPRPSCARAGRRLYRRSKAISGGSTAAPGRAGSTIIRPRPTTISRRCRRSSASARPRRGSARKRSPRRKGELQPARRPRGCASCATA